MLLKLMNIDNLTKYDIIQSVNKLYSKIYGQLNVYTPIPTFNSSKAGCAQ